MWELDEKTGEYYLHHFYKHQPDLNIDHPPVVDELMSAIGFWMQLGLDGFNVDGVPFFGQLGDVEGHDDIVDTHRFVRQLRDFVSRRNGSAAMVGEVDLPYEQQLAYFGGEAGDQLHMQFDFVAMQATYLSLARADVRPLVTALTSRPDLPRQCQWATFLRNHDEATLDQLTEEERQEVFAAFGPEPEMQIYGRGLKRRLPPMLQGEPRRVRMAYSLLMSLPGTPTLYYGEEIGIGEDLEREGRMAVRTPMQWTSGHNGGFSRARTSQLICRPVSGSYGPEHVNVLDQLHDDGSLLSWIRTLIHIRHSCQELGWGELTVLEHDAGEAVLAHRVDHGAAGVLTLHNLGPEPVPVAVPLDDAGEDAHVVDLLTHDPVHFPDGRLEVALEGYGVRWVRIRPGHDLGLP
ncbi:MAG: trehalose synthase [Acidobacteria bacterium]|nr:MAG: trehalose synthase [Acidobacteriota bacterium]